MGRMSGLVTKERRVTMNWSPELAVARGAAQAAGNAIRKEFGVRDVVGFKGRYDVQLRADLIAQQVIVDRLSEHSEGYGIVAEEGLQDGWFDSSVTWVVDPLDGTNNFGYGIAHCAISICLFDGSEPVMALVHDPILGREYEATRRQPMPPLPRDSVSLDRATVALVVDYSTEGRIVGREIESVLSARCKRVTAMWAPALDLALLAVGNMDAMVCRNASLLDVCAGLFLVTSAGGCVLGPDGRNLVLDKAMCGSPVSFVAARNEGLARRMLDVVRCPARW